MYLLARNRIDFIGALSTTNKYNQHIFIFIDAFTKFTWLYSIKSIFAKYSYRSTRGNVQVEIMHGTLILILSKLSPNAKLSLKDLVKLFQHVDKLQRVLNHTTWTFKLLIGVGKKEDLQIVNILQEARKIWIGTLKWEKKPNKY
ncbi:hypothetical protein CEXT_362601 [Caerostris extrusa]|uniref:Homing endonuclease LAGLIDADG domain-containing protein n=1 Tax=Caerostris extrusa TaxID=172846 RepID=A0AAV4W391_CAEEX|nr:hypothetical protein CEXT_362601 [Caerostris extrusa]